ncbi:MAG: response regulator [Oscillospiraceae bacterium]|nr:response regulator [Oscillospiraceae bacterium]
MIDIDFVPIELKELPINVHLDSKLYSKIAQTDTQVAEEESDYSLLCAGINITERLVTRLIKTIFPETVVWIKRDDLVEEFFNKGHSVGYTEKEIDSIQKGGKPWCSKSVENEAKLNSGYIGVGTVKPDMGFAPMDASPDERMREAFFMDAAPITRKREAFPMDASMGERKREAFPMDASMGERKREALPMDASMGERKREALPTDATPITRKREALPTDATPIIRKKEAPPTKVESVSHKRTVYSPSANNTATVKRKKEATTMRVPNVLVVDDSLLMRTIIKKILVDNGFNVVGEAVNGRLGVEKYIELKPDIVTLDITLDEMDGIETLKAIKKINPDSKVVMVSAIASQTLIAEELNHAGANACITKPFKEDELLKVLLKVSSS